LFFPTRPATEITILATDTTSPRAAEKNPCSGAEEARVFPCADEESSYSVERGRGEAALRANG